MPLNYKFRLYPTKEQELVLEQTLGGCRWVYNYFLSIPQMSEYDMNYALTELKELSLRILLPVEHREFTPAEIPKELQKEKKQESCVATHAANNNRRNEGNLVREASAL